MKRKQLLVAAAAVVVSGLGVGLLIAVRGATSDPSEGKASWSVASDRSPAPSRSTPSLSVTPEKVSGVAPAPVPEGGFKKFVSPPGQEAKPFGTDPALRFQIPKGGFGAWTGREGTWPGEVEAFATEAKVHLPVALELRRSTLLEERTDQKHLEEILGKPATGEMLDAVKENLRVLSDTITEVQLSNRDGKLSDDVAMKRARAATEAYRRGYMQSTGLTGQQFDELFSPSRPFN